MKQKAVKIELERAEGRTSECIKVTCTHEGCTTTGYHGREPERPYFVSIPAKDVWERANAVLARWSHTAPKTGGYDKCDFKITYEDGETYEGRYDLTHMSKDGYPSLENHMQAFLECYSGRRKPSHLSDEKWALFLRHNVKAETLDEASKFLDDYEIGSAA